MKVELTAQLGDGIPKILWEAHEIGNVVKATNSIPCSICRGIHDSGVNEFTRNHFHVSSDIGGCERKVFNLMTTGKRTGLSGFNFLNDGHVHEEAILKSINAGLPDGYRLKVSKNAVEGEYNDESGFKLIGHTDALLITPNGIAGIECKAVKQAMWKKITENAEIPDEWYGQAQGYMLIWKIDSWYFVVKHRETSKIIIPFKVSIDPPYIIEKRNKLRRIYEKVMTGNTEQPKREHESSKDYECQWCAFGNNIGDGSCWREDIKNIKFEIK